MEDEALIREQMEESRTALSEKLETLEQKVSDTVQGAAAAVNETVETIKETVYTVKETVQDTVSAVKGSVQEGVATVKDWMDLRAHVEHCPWTMTGGAVLVGYLLGSMFNQRPAPTAPPDRPQGEGMRNGNGRRLHATVHPRPKRHAEPQGMRGYLAEFAPEIEQLKALALGTLLSTAREMIVQVIPEHLGHEVGEIVDSVTRKVGGKPFSASDLEEGSSNSLQGESHEQRDETEMGGPMGSAQRQGQESLGRFDRR